MRNSAQSEPIRRCPKTSVAVEDKVVHGPNLDHERIFTGTLWRCAYMRLYLAFDDGGRFRANGRADGSDIAVAVRQPYRTVRRLSDRCRVTGKCPRRLKSLRSLFETEDGMVDAGPKSSAAVHK